MKRVLLAASMLAFALACGGGAKQVLAEGDEPGECEDGADNDRDGVFDCDDSECKGAPACKQAAAPAPAEAAKPVRMASSDKAKVRAAPAPVVADDQPAVAAAPAVVTAAGDCSTTCRHLLKCAGQPELQAECVGECRVAGHDPEFLAWFQTTDCATALTVVAMLSGDGGGGQAAGGQAKSTNSQCDGCVRDGGECNWYSQSNWGSQGAYSGAVITCDQSCCP
jgi:hypothetical protein